MKKMAEKKTNQQNPEEQTPKASSHAQLVDVRIIGGRCEFCGKLVEECEAFGELFRNKQFRCLCGGSNNPSTFSQSIYKYWKKGRAWICNSEGCRRAVENMGGYQDPEILQFYL